MRPWLVGWRHWGAATCFSAEYTPSCRGAMGVIISAMHDIQLHIVVAAAAAAAAACCLLLLLCDAPTLALSVVPARRSLFSFVRRSSAAFYAL
jgi:hypothetical protein